MKRLHILLPVIIIVFPTLSLWGLTKGEYEKKFDARGKKLIVDWGLFESIEEKERLENHQVDRSPFPLGCNRKG